MTNVVLDASALLALLLGEPGARRVSAVLDGALLGAVNLAEIVSHYAKLGASRSDIETLLGPLPVRVVPIDGGLSYEAGDASAAYSERRPVTGRSILPGPGQARGRAGAYGGKALAGDRQSSRCHG